MKKILEKIVFVSLITLLLSSCCSAVYIAGSGASKSVVTHKKQWYALWGLVRMNKVSPQVLAGDAKNYTVKTEFGFGDMLTNVFTSIISLERETVTVIK